jgi:hypothetical protein
MWTDIRKVDEAHSPSERQGNRPVLPRSTPVVFRKAALHWPALKRWTAEQLLVGYGDRPVSMYRTRNGHIQFDPKTGLIQEKHPLRKVLEPIVQGKPVDLRVRCILARELSEMENDIVIPDYCRRQIRLELNWWLSPPGIRSQLHFDQPDNLLVQIQGTKRVWMFPRTDSKYLRPFLKLSPIPQFSQLDLSGLPSYMPGELRKAHPWYMDLEPGDMVYMPGGLWHYLDSKDFTVSLGFRWSSLLRAPLLIASDIYKSVFGVTK